MSKGDIYKLVDPNGYVVSWLEFTDDYCTGFCYEPYSWDSENCDDKNLCESNFLGEFFCKTDGCTHWWFHGEDYDIETMTDKDAYYHLCGTDTFMQHIRSMCFVWKVAAMTHIKERPTLKEFVAESYFDHRGRDTGITKLIKLMLTGYEIKKEK